MSKEKLPQGYQTITPSLMFEDGAVAIDFYKKLFGANEKYRLVYNNKIIHAEILIGTSTIMLGDVSPEMPGKTAKQIGDTPVVLYIYVDNVDEVFKKASDLGAKIDYSPETQMYGDRIGAITDPFGYRWTIATRVEEVPIEYIQENIDEFVDKMKNPDINYREKYLKYKQKYLELKNKLTQK